MIPNVNPVYIEVGFRVMGWAAVLWGTLTGLYIALFPHRLITNSWMWLDAIPGGGVTVGVGFILGAILSAICLRFRLVKLGAKVTFVSGMLLLFMAFAMGVGGLLGTSGGLGGFTYALIAVFYFVQSRVLLESHRE